MKKKYIYLLIGIIFSILIFGFLMFRSTSMNKSEEINSVKILKDGNELTVFSDGNVVYKTSEGTFKDFWSSEKTNAFFSYVNDNYNGTGQTLYPTQDQIIVDKNGISYSYSVSSSSDELVTAVIEDSQEEDSSNNTSPTATPASGGAEEEDTCLYWKISYCVTFRTSAPTATPVGTPDPNANVIDATGCGDYVTGGNEAKTIISNTVCLPTPTP